MNGSESNLIVARVLAVLLCLGSSVSGDIFVEEFGVVALMLS
jgi:hypothetical protein